MTLCLPLLIALSLGCCAGTALAAGESRILPVTGAICDQMKARRVLASGAPVGCERLGIVRFSYVDFDGRTHDDGQIMVMTATANRVQAIFDALYQRRFPIARARLMNHYLGDDAAAMRDNNTSAFNHRPITGGSTPSLHAYGLAIDLNPVQNPYIQFDGQGRATYSPAAGSKYANRLNPRPAKAARPGMAEEVVQLFADNGFPVWGGYWDAPIDYQHFQVSRGIAERMAALPTAQAHALFASYIERYRNCVIRNRDQNETSARSICATESVL